MAASVTRVPIATGSAPTRLSRFSAARIDAPVEMTSSTSPTLLPLTASTLAASKSSLCWAPVVMDLTGSVMASRRCSFGVFCKMR